MVVGELQHVLERQQELPTYIEIKNLMPLKPFLNFVNDLIPLEQSTDIATSL